MSFVTDQNFNDLILKWARDQFAYELRSDFQRARNFDSFLSQRQLDVLLDRPKVQLETLAHVLPLNVLYNSPTQNERRSLLPAKEKEAVEKLRMDYDNDYKKYWSQHVRNLARKDDAEVKAEFKIASRNGKNMLKRLAKQLNCEAASAAPGEWGLIFYKSHLRIAVSLELGRNMELAYRISVSDKLSFQRFCFRASYFGVLGIGSGAWKVDTANQLPEKLSQASEFALWHEKEYEKIIDQIIAT